MIKSGLEFRERVYELVRQIPEGRVMTYGQLAALAGSPMAARIVGGIAHYGDPDLPWQRVVNKQGGLASGYPGGRKAHKEHLEAEGILVSDELKVNVEKLLWRPEQVDRSGQTVDGRGEYLYMPSTKYSLLSTYSPLVVIVGETASGKSSLAMEIAGQFKGEIIAADSWTVYREFNIGTAKPSVSERERVVHHLIDVVDAPDGFNAALYKDLADEAITQISAKGKLPVLVGGTGLYIDSVIYNFGFLPVVSAHERELRNKQDLSDLLKEAAERKIDLSGIDTRNKRRVIRALETNGQRPSHGKIRPNTIVIGLQIDREKLAGQITKRVDKMIDQGLEVEVRQLAQKYGWDVEPMKGIGYIEWQDYINGSKSLHETKERIVKSTMNLAKRQRTWFRSPRYDNLPASDSSFLAKTIPDSIDVPMGMPRSPKTVLTQQSPSLNQPTYQSVGTGRNNIIHWVADPSDAVDLVTTFLNKKQ